MNNFQDLKNQDVLVQLNSELVKIHFPEIDNIKFDDCKNLFAQGKFKVSAVENLIPAVKQFCRRIYAEMGILLNCSLHLTPPLESKEVNYQTNFQHLLVYQISGKCKWRFPLLDGKPYRELSNRPKSGPKLKSNDLQFLEKVTSPAEALFIPYALTCTVSAGTNTPCMFLTFAEEEINVRDVLNFLTEELLRIKDFETRFFEAFEQNDFLQEAQPYSAETALKKVDDFYSRTRMAKFKNSQTN